MALSLNLGSAFGASVNVGVLPWLTTALKEIQDDGNLIKVADVLSPLDRQAVIKITNTRIANVYQTLAKGVIPIGNQSANVSGQSIFCELTATASRTVTGAPDILVPVVSRIELRLPNDAELDDTVAKQLLLANYAALCDANAVLKITDKMRGSLIAL